VCAAISAWPRVEERAPTESLSSWRSHATIGHLVGAQRPTVSLALHALAEAGLLRRGDTGAWTLSFRVGTRRLRSAVERDGSCEWRLIRNGPT
jgi:DNA-binding IclR family transcriptional regulator